DNSRKYSLVVGRTIMSHSEASTYITASINIDIIFYYLKIALVACIVPSSPRFGEIAIITYSAICSADPLVYNELRVVAYHMK
ncbi:hypothetical protein J1N35_026122, partial [Gossypium stocksii]